MEDAILARAQRGQIGEKVSEDVVIQMLQAGSSGAAERSAGPSVSFRRRNLDDDDEW